MKKILLAILFVFIARSAYTHFWPFTDYQNVSQDHNITGVVGGEPRFGRRFHGEIDIARV